MITFHNIQTVFTRNLHGKFCIEIEFRVKDLEDYQLCWMGVMPDNNDPQKRAFWFGLASDGSKAYDYDNFAEFSSAPVFDGKTLEEVWGNVELLSVDSCPPEERIADLIT